MKNRISALFITILILVNCQLSMAKEQFEFNVTQIEVYENGNKFKGLKRGKINTDSNINLEADEFEYNKITNILVANGNVIIKDLENNILIETENVIYKKNEELIFTNTRSKATGKNTIINADSFKYNKKQNELYANGNVLIDDLLNDILIESEDLNYLVNKNIIFTNTRSKATGKNTIINADSFNFNRSTNELKAQGNAEINDLVKKIIVQSDRINFFKNEERFDSKGKSKAFDNGLTINADEFEYNKILNIANAYKNVVINDEIQDVIIFTENSTYFRNKEKIITEGKTEAISENKYNFNSKDTVFLRNKGELSSEFNTIITDDDDNFYNLKNFNYLTKTKLLRGNNIKITTNYKKEKSDNFIFSNGIFDLEKKEFKGKDTKVFLHNNIFQKEKEKFLELIGKTEINKLVDEDKIFENKPRLFGASSSGNQDKTVVNKGIFTSCKNSKDDCPSWSMRSKKITHDKVKRQLIYENSVLNLYDMPVFYFPKFFHPDPTVKRQSGFLRPQLNRSKTLGTSLYLPYFKVISDNKDFTFKPQIFDSEIEMFQNEYRQVNKNSSFIADFGITKGYQSSINGSRRNSMGHLFAKYDKDLEIENFDNSDLKITIESVTNDTFLNVFKNNLIKSSVKPNSLNSLESGIDFYVDNEDYNFSTGLEVYESLSGKDSDRYQYNFPNYAYSTNFSNEIFNGTFGFSSSGNNVLNNTNVMKTTINNDLTYSSLDYFSNLGFQNNFNIYFKNLNTVAKNHSNYKNNPQSQIMSLFEARSSFPLEKISKNFNESITPNFSFRLNPSHMKSLTNRNVNVDNIFSINRLGINEAYEEGKSLTLGLNYLKEKILTDEEIAFNEENEKNKIEKFFEFKLAGVLRDVNEDKIGSSTTLNRKASNLFGSITNKLYEKIQLDYNFAIDNDLSTFESNEINLRFHINNFITTFDFSETNGEMGDSNQISNSTLYKFNDNNYLTFGTRRNRKISLTEYYDLVYEYKNDCLTAGIKYQKTYYSDRDAKPTEDLMLTLTLFPLTTLEQDVEQSFYRDNDLFN